MQWWLHQNKWLSVVLEIIENVIYIQCLLVLVSYSLLHALVELSSLDWAVRSLS